MDEPAPGLHYPRRLLIRGVLRRLIAVSTGILGDFQVTGREHLPPNGPLLVVGNHFSFLDPVAMIRVTPWPLEFLGGAQRVFAPLWARWIPTLWGILPVFRGTGSRGALRAAESILAQGGVLGIFPEGGSWATVLRPARPGTAFLAARTGCRLVPIGFDGLLEMLPTAFRGRRGRVNVRIGEPFGPFQVEGHGRTRRGQLEEIGHEMMRRIAALIPPERRGHYSEDPAIRAAAQGTEVYPWDDEPEA